MKNQYKITTYGKRYGVSKNNRCSISIRLYSKKAAIRAIKLLKTGVDGDDIDGNGVFVKGYFED